VILTEGHDKRHDHATDEAQVYEPIDYVTSLAIYRVPRPGKCGLPRDCALAVITQLGRIWIEPNTKDGVDSLHPGKKLRISWRTAASAPHSGSNRLPSGTDG
jgi:hypothetical protein